MKKGINGLKKFAYELEAALKQRGYSLEVHNRKKRLIIPIILISQRMETICVFRHGKVLENKRNRLLICLPNMNLWSSCS